MRKFVAFAGLLAGTVVLSAGFAGQGWGQAAIQMAPSTLIETRQAGQDLMASIVDNMKATVAAKGDVKPYADQADAISRWLKNFPQLFPAGTETGHDTKAKPEVWSDPAGFAKAAANASAAAASLATAAKSGDAEAFAAQFKTLGGTCGACHRTYKVRT
jgi:cytochrome c556